MSDKELYQLCKKYGSMARKWRQQFALLLPEVAKRELYRKYGFSTIFEFAAKLCGMSFEHTKQVLRVSKKVEQFPQLKKIMPEVGWSKVRTVLSVVDNENEEEWVQKAKILSKKALEECVKSVPTSKKQSANYLNHKSENALAQNSGDTFLTISFKVDRETQFLLRKFQKKLGAVTLNEALKELLKNQPVAKNRKSHPIKPSRYIPAARKREVGDKCVYPGCNKPYDEIHHPERYAIVKNHNNIKPLCHTHHELAHAGLIKNETKQPETWRLRRKPKPNLIDYLVQAHSISAYAHVP